MARAFIDTIDITEGNEVVITGQLSSTNLSVSLEPQHPIVPPADGIWSYDLVVIPTTGQGATVLVPFKVSAPWIGDSEANGVRLLQAVNGPNDELEETVQLKAKVVGEFTRSQRNKLQLRAAFFDASRQQLVIEAAYTGGCFSHAFSLEWDGRTLESFPVQYSFNLIDLSDRDPCRSLVRTQLRFDISSADIQLESPSTIRLSTPPFSNTLAIPIK